MRTNFFDILSAHSKAYPQMKAEDYYALAYESEFGQVFEGDCELEALTTLLEKTKTDALEPFTVTIGGGYSRLNLAPVKHYLSVQNIIALASMAHKQGSTDGLQRKLSLISRSGKMGLIPPNAIDADNCDSSSSHSALYTHLYGASYRIIPSDVASVVPALCLISEALGKAETVRIALDGRRGSGKGFVYDVISRVFKTEYDGGCLKISNAFSSFINGVSYDLKFYIETDEDTRMMRVIERGGESEWEKYINEERPYEYEYLKENEPSLQCDLVIRT
jgi:hypothetical protein